MSYKALYRTYRPTTFKEVSGQQFIVTILQNAIKTNKIGHAYLFTGPRGTGKTTMAKLFAKALNCDEGIGCQCNHCKNCEAINNGSHPDVIEIDAASNNGVDEVRDLIEKVHYSTILGRYKVYIIDEVHMMTPGAFNALLKTLEEPPENVIFILATTEPHKILPTILSRCQRFDFSKISDKDIKDRLLYVLNKENVTYDEEGLDLIVSLSDGGMRDALSILDQVLAFSPDHLNGKDVLNIFSIESKQEKLGLIDDIIKGNTQSVLDRINNYVSRGTDIKRLTNDLLHIYKEALIYARTFNEELLEVLNEKEANNIISNISIDTILRNIDILLDAIKDYRVVTNINPIFEIAILKLISNNTLEKPNVIKQEEKVTIDKPFIRKTVIGTSDNTVTTTKIEEPKPVPQPIPEVQIETIKEEKPTPIFDKFDESKLDTTIIYPNVASVVEGLYSLSSDDLINITIIAKRDIKTKLNNKWSELNKLSSHPKYGAKAALLYDGHLLIATKDIMIIEYDILANVKKVNTLEAQKELQILTQLLFNKKYFVYALSRKDSVDLQVRFKNMREVNKLEKPENIQITMIGVN